MTDDIEIRALRACVIALCALGPEMQRRVLRATAALLDLDLDRPPERYRG